MPDDSASRFRPHLSPSEQTPAQQTLHRDILGAAIDLEALINELPKGRYHALAMTALEQAVLWSVRALVEPPATTPQASG